MASAAQIVRTLYDGLAPLRVRNLRIYLSGQTVSLIGVFMQQTAQSWVVWDLTHSGAALGIAAMLGFLPLFLLGPWTGVWADRLDRRRLLVVTQVAAMLLAFAFAVLVQTNAIALWHVYVLALLLGFVTAFDFPTQQAFIGDLSGMELVRKAVVTNAMIVQISRTVGPALAGWLIAVAGEATAFWLNGATFLAVIGTLFLVSGTQVRRPRTGSTLGEFREGIRFIRSEPRAQDLILLTGLVAFFAMSTVFVLPAVTTDVLQGGPQILGYLLGASGAGALVGSLVATPLAQGARRTGLVLGGSAAWTGGWLVAFSLWGWFPFSLAGIFLISLLIPVVMTSSTGLLQVLSPPAMRARVLSTLVMVTFGTLPIASLVTGLMVDAFDVMTALRINGLLLVGGAIGMLAFRRELRDWVFEAPSAPPLAAVSGPMLSASLAGLPLPAVPAARATAPEGPPPGP
ncbi:MAG TPA: MFS transporter [Thermoplasmata archaeon]|nr:MFS transporter [Thermoplasmata archaeon]